jgi:hypothetical protein
MVFIETPIFTQRIKDLLRDDAYSELQEHLAQYPHAGNLIRGGGGLRKVRWAISGGGKSGGVRVIYYWAIAQDQILMVFVYPKNERDNLSDRQLKALRDVIRESYP